jgi:hypothetical protein
MRFATEELQEFYVDLSKNLHYFFELRVHRCRKTKKEY